MPKTPSQRPMGCLLLEYVIDLHTKPGIVLELLKVLCYSQKSMYVYIAKDYILLILCSTFALVSE